MEEKILCFFHANCVDGAASAAVIRQKYPQAKCYPMNHGDPLRAKVKGKNVFIVDFSFKPEVLRRFKKEAASVHWYDHHITAVPIQKEVGWGDIELKESGASLTWKKEYPNQPLPRILEYVRDKDLYEWKLPDSREISMYLRGVTDITNPLSEFWKKSLEGIPEPQWQTMIEKGGLALKYQTAQLKQGLKSAFEINFHGHRTLALNWILEASDMGEMIYKDLGYDVALMFYYTGHIWNFSLRSEKVDVSKLALKFGGGGHPGASGFRTESVDWLLKLKKKSSEKK
jgi:oligoribonuclease NrnB/cAMP/cGMP phosphodiesterase (DHH superfamily)